MTRSTRNRLASAPGRISRWVSRRLSGDGGFILLESVIAISLITVIMAAIGAEYVSGLSATSHQRATTIASELADTSMEQLRALHPTDLLTGRDQNSVIAERNTLNGLAAVSPYISTAANRLAYDSKVSSGGATAAVPTAPTSQSPGPSNRVYQVYQYLDCDTTTTDGSCLTNTVDNLRATVAVVWPQNGCPAGTCAFVTSTLINLDGDPTFDTNQPLPASPVITDPGTQVVEVGDAVTLQLNTGNTGVSQFTWAQTGTWPSWLSLNTTTGLISSAGTVPSSATTTSVGVSVTDGLGRVATLTINFTVYPKLTFTVPNQVNFLNANVSVGLAQYTSGGNGPYTYAKTSTLPAGLTLSGATISGTPTSVGTTTVKLTVTDSTGHSTPATFSWTINYPPLGLTQPQNDSSTINVADSLQMTATGGDGKYSWLASGLPSGLTISASTGLISGTPTVLGTSSVTVTVTDTAVSPSSQSVTFTWTVYTAPTIASLGAVAATEGQTVDQSVSYTCPSMTCTLTLSGTVPGVGLATAASTSNNTATTLSVTGSGTVHVTGLVGSTAVTGTSQSAGYNPVVTITNPAGSSAHTASVSWTAYAPPSVTALATQKNSVGDRVSVPLAYTCPHSACTLSLVNGPGGLSVTGSAAAGYAVTGTITGSAASLTNVQVRVADAGGVSVTSSASTWTVMDTCLGTAKSLNPYFYYQLGESSGTTAADSSGNNNAGTYTSSGVTYGVSGSCAHDSATAVALDGTAGQITTPNSITNPQVFTIEAWFKTTSTTGGELIGFANTQTGAPGNYDRHLYLDNAGNVVFGVYNSGATTIASTGTYNDGQWHLATATLSASTGMQLYVDGKSVASNTTVTTAQSYSGYWRIGYDSLSGWSGTNTTTTSSYYQGALDDVAYFQSALSATQIAGQYSAANYATCLAAATASNPSFYYQLGDSSGTSATDNSGNARTGTYTSSGVTYGVSGSCAHDSATAVTLDGSAGQISTPTQLTNPTVFTIQAWFKTTSTTGGVLMGFANTQTGSPSSYDRHLYLDNAGNVVFGVYPSGAKIIASSGTYNDGKWHLATATLSPAGMLLYVDGQQVAANSAVTTAQSYSGYWRIGYNSLGSTWGGSPTTTTNSYFKGSLDDVAYYPSALTSDQIYKQYVAAS